MVLNKNSHTAKAEGETFSIDVTSNVNVELKIEHPGLLPLPKNPFAAEAAYNPHGKESGCGSTEDSP